MSRYRPYHPVIPVGNDSMATLALVCAVAGFCCLPASVLAVVCGALGRGPGAVVGFVVGLVQLLLVVAVVAFMVIGGFLAGPPPG